MKNLIIFILAAAGFLLSWHIWRQKQKNKPLVCLIGEDCNKVIFSSYATILGIPNEVLGMIYFGGLALASLAIYLNLAPEIISLGTRMATALAATFSLILIVIQAFILKEWCEWCLASSLLSMSIFSVVWIA